MRTSLVLVAWSLLIFAGCGDEKSPTNGTYLGPTLGYVEGGADWVTDKGIGLKKWLGKKYNRLMDEQTVDVEHSQPRKAETGDGYTLDVTITIKGTKSGRFHKTYPGIQCDQEGKLPPEGQKKLGEAIESDKKTIQDIQW